MTWSRIVWYVASETMPRTQQVELGAIWAPLHDGLGVHRAHPGEGGEHFLRGGVDIDQAVGALGVEVGVVREVEIVVVSRRRGTHPRAQQQGDEGEEQDEPEQAACSHQGLGEK
jgi:hypothetical protein